MKYLSDSEAYKGAFLRQASIASYVMTHGNQGMLDTGLIMSAHGINKADIREVTTIVKHWAPKGA